MLALQNELKWLELPCSAAVNEKKRLRRLFLVVRGCALSDSCVTTSPDEMHPEQMDVPCRSKVWLFHSQESVLTSVLHQALVRCNLCHGDPPASAAAAGGPGGGSSGLSGC